MQFRETDLAGAWVIEPEFMRDSRGFFARLFCEAEYTAHGLNPRFVQHSASHSAKKGTIRGMHFQTAPHAEVKVVRCVRGAILDVIIDLRPSSATFRNWRSFELSGESGRQLYVPKGFAHGFQTLTDDAEVIYLISEPYAPASATGVRFDDPAFAIRWPLPVTSISERDKSWPDFRG
jgi:dTDP-4-dehydrorhamnose 3,5-epimerase